MNRNITGAVVAALFCILWFCPVMAESQDMLSTDISAHPVQFIENDGQAHANILYQVKTAELSFDFTNTSLLVSGSSKDCETCNNLSTRPVVVTVSHAAQNVSVVPFDKLDGYANFLIGKNQSEWQKFVPWYGGITYVDILPGVNLSYTGKDGLLKREFIVQKGVDPGIIRLEYEGSHNLSVAPDGALLVSTDFGTLTELAPYTYQEINGVKSEVNASYQIGEDGEVGYAMGSYDPSYPLIIDPYLEYATLLGGSLEDYGMDIASDSSGNVYVTGYTSSCDFPLINPLIINSAYLKFNGSYCHNSRDVFVTKIGVNQTTGNASILFSTYLGGSNADYGRGIAVDSLNCIYVAGDTFSEDFPIMLPFAYGSSLHGSNDAFVIKLGPNGADIRWSDYLGGNFADQANDIALDSMNAVYLTGQTVGNSPTKPLEDIFPVTANAYQTSPNPDAVMGDAFATKISPTGQSIEYSTYISGSAQDAGNGIAVDNSGMAYIVGTTSSSNLLPSGVPYFQPTLKGAQDAFLFKMNLQANLPPVYATYLGGSDGNDYGQAVAVDDKGSAYVTGATASRDFPVYPSGQAMQTVKGWPYDAFEKDAFVTKFNALGDGLIYSTYLGGTKDDWGYDIKVDDTYRAFVTGYSSSSQIPRSGLVNPIKQASGGQDGFLTVIKKDGKSAESSTLFGGYRDDVGRGVTISLDGNTSYVTGYTSSPTMQNLLCGDDCESEAFPVYKWINQTVYGNRLYIGGNFTGNYQGSFDAFVMKFGQPSLNPSFRATPVCGQGSPNLSVTFTETTTGSDNVLNRIWNFGDGTPVNDTGSVPMVISHNYTSPGTYLATLTLYTYTSVLVSDPVSITFCNPYISANFTVAGYNNSVPPIDVPINTDITFNGWALNYTPSSYVWEFDDGTLNQTEQTTHHLFTKQGNYTVNLTAASGTCCDVNNENIVGSKQLRVLAPPLARFETPSLREGCAPLSVNFFDVSPTGTTSYGVPTSWQWNFGDSTNNVTIQNVTHVYTRPGTYTVTLTASNIAGSSSYQEAGYIVVSDNVTAGFTATPRADTVPMVVQFTDTSDGVPTSWDWDFGDGGTNTTQNPSHEYTTAGTYTVSLTADNGCGDPSIASYPAYITVNANLTPNILFGKNSTNYLPIPVNGTAGLNVSFLGNTSDGSLIDSAVWDFGDSITQTQTRGIGWPLDNSWFNTSHVYSAVKNYTPVLVVTNATYGPGTSGGLYADWIGVYPPMAVNFSAEPSSGVVGQSILFTDHSSGSPVDWQWFFNDLSPSVRGQSSVTHSYNQSAIYNISLEIWNKYGATAIGYKNVNITPADVTGDISFIPQNITLIADDLNYRIINLQLNKADYGLSSYTIKIDLNNTTHATLRDWAVQPSWVDHFSHALSSTSDSITLSGYKDSGGLSPGSRNISLGNISITGISDGEAHLTLNSSFSQAQYGNNFMMVSGLVPADVHIYLVNALPGYQQAPTDIWPSGIHDGLIDDFDGNGVVNTADVSVFFNVWVNTGFAGMPIPPFDYNHNNRIDTQDIVAYFNLIW